MAGGTKMIRKGNMKKYSVLVLIVIVIGLFLLPDISLSSDKKKEPKNIDFFIIVNGKIDYTSPVTELLKVSTSEEAFPPLTQQDYVQITVPSIFLGRYSRSWWGLSPKNDIFLTLSVDNGDGKLRVYKTDNIKNLRSGRFAPVFNAIVMPVEILKGNYITVKVEGYITYERKIKKLKENSKSILESVSPFIPGAYTATAGVALDSFNKLLSLKEDDQIFDFTITFDVLANQTSVDIYNKSRKIFKQSAQPLLRPRKYPIINTNDPYSLTLSLDSIKKEAFNLYYKWKYSKNLINVYGKQNTERCSSKENTEEVLKLKNDILYIRCGKKDGNENIDFHQVLDHNYLIVQISPWIRDFSKEKFHEPLNKLRSKWRPGNDPGQISRGEALSLINESRAILRNDPSFNILTKQAYSEFLFKFLEDFYTIVLKSESDEDTGKLQGNTKSDKAIDINSLQNACIRLNSFLYQIKPKERVINHRLFADYDCTIIDSQLYASLRFGDYLAFVRNLNLYSDSYDKKKYKKYYDIEDYIINKVFSQLNITKTNNAILSIIKDLDFTPYLTDFPKEKAGEIKLIKSNLSFFIELKPKSTSLKKVYKLIQDSVVDGIISNKYIYSYQSYLISVLNEKQTEKVHAILGDDNINWLIQIRLMYILEIQRYLQRVVKDQ